MNESIHARFVRWRVEDLIVKYPGLRLRPGTHRSIALGGTLYFCAETPSKECLDDEYDIEIIIPEEFPHALPTVNETAGRIPRSFHKLEDGSLCLGSPVRLRLILVNTPSLVLFVEKCVIPYLYGHSHFEKYGILPFGELKHGREGLCQDLAALYGGNPVHAVPMFVRLTGMKRRQANKASCPCGSGRRLGRCHNRQVNELRSKLGRPWFRFLSRELRD